MQLTKTLLHTTDAYIKKLHDAGVETIADFLTYFPRDIDDKSDLLTRFSGLTITEKQAIKCTIELMTSETTRNKKLLIKAVLVDADGSYAEAVWFNRRFLLQQFASWDTVVLYGQPKYEYGRLSFSSADIEHYREKRQEIVPVYSDLNYISGAWIREKMRYLEGYIDDFRDEIPESIRSKNMLRGVTETMRSIHFPRDRDDFEQAKREIGYRELFRFQKVGIEKKYALKSSSLGLAPALPIDTDLMKELITSLPFELTDKQKIVIFQILKDMEKPHAMVRMLQWDVGTGKTVVAILVAVHMILVGRRHGQSLQCAIMAPTEILARQHFLGQEDWLRRWDISCDLLVGSLTPRLKEDVRARLFSGQTEIIFWTHALIQDGVKFSCLGLVIVDEQHRFGVEQRKMLEAYTSPLKGKEEKFWKNFSEGWEHDESPDASHQPLSPGLAVPHVLNMSATPIPRSLALTLYGDQDISVLNEYPKWRKPIHTKVVREDQRGEVYNWIDEEVKNGRQVYWISPLVEESETLDIASATNMYEILSGIFPHRSVGLIHGKMSGKEKDQIMQDFYEGKIDILSSTSVVEVGVNNPNATIICIEAAERFGLSQLHQFRGRVGRGEHQSYCYLFTTKEYKNDRLRAMEKTGDGFELAEIDLELRWPGEVYGVRQSWLPDMHFADLRDVDMIAQVRQDIEEWLGWKKGVVN